MIRTVLIDDHKLFTEGIERLLEGSGLFKIIEKFSNGYSLLENLNTLNPDLLLLDIDIPGLSGLDVIKRIRLYNSSIKIVFLSMHEESVFLKEANILGANGYLAKSIESNQLIESLVEVCNGVNVFPVIKNSERQSNYLLSEREIEVLRLIAQGKTSEQISKELNISPLTIKTHRRNMAKKLRAKNTAELIKKALESGIL